MNEAIESDPGKSEKSDVSFFNQNWKLNQVPDITAPELYSRKAIYFFSIFLSVLFGGTLMFINLRRLKNTKGQVVVAIYTILFLVLSQAILLQYERNTLLTLLVSLIGATPFYTFFWSMYIGKHTTYRPRSIVTPLIVAAIISVLLFLIILLDMGMI